MIDKLKLTNFKCFKEETIHFKPMTILTGANAAGKSSVIQAFLLMQHSNCLLYTSRGRGQQAGNQDKQRDPEGQGIKRRQPAEGCCLKVAGTGHGFNHL